MEVAPESRLRLSIDHLLEGVQVLGHDWTYIYVNRTAASHGQQAVDALLGRTLMACYPGIETTPLFALLDRVMQRRRAERMLNEFTYPSGERRWFELMIEPVPDGICVLSLDVTEQQANEVQLRHAQKMETIGQLAGGIAHDLNNILTAILGFAELITDQIGPDKPIGSDLQEIVAAGRRGATLTRKLLAFSRKQGLQRAPVSLSGMVAGIEPMLTRLLGEHIAIHTRMDPALPAVVADLTELEQVLTNLVVNARDAIRDRGTITIATCVVALDEQRASHLHVSPGTYAVLEVADTGSGMTPDVQARIFEPFYTTKEHGRGTGLGLAAVRQIVAQLGGTIEVASARGRGSTFSIYIPATDLPVAPAISVAKSALPVGHEHILLVEDEDGVRSFASKVLHRHGYVVSQAGSAEAALAELDSKSMAPIDLLLTDVMLSGMDGPQFAQRVLRGGREVPVLFISGCSETMVPPLPPGASFLEKPFTAQTLLGRVRALLDARAQRPKQEESR
jgi:two-component system cell cycle sensor histidine kinase/response regulator CckA